MVLWQCLKKTTAALISTLSIPLISIWLRDHIEFYINIRKVINLLLVIISPVHIVPFKYNGVCFDQTDSSLVDKERLHSLKIGKTRY
jgi:hypothetical protein